MGDAQTDRFGSYFGAGVTASGLLGMAANDEAGLAVAVAGNGSHFLAAQTQQGVPTTRSEKTIDLTYLHTVNASLYIQPDLQYIIDPGTNPRIRNALAFQLRFELAY